VGWAAAAAPPPVTPPGPASGWASEYFANTTLSGTPALTRTDATINFDWGAGGPGSGIPVDNFSARWKQSPTLAAGDYTFSVAGDDGIRVKVDGQTIIDGWKDQGETAYSRTVTLAAGQHNIVVEYYEHGGDAVAKASYKAVTAAPPPTTTCAAGRWKAEIFANLTLSGTPASVVCTDDIQTDWGEDGPAGVGNDNFSIRWTQVASLAAGSYSYRAVADDGMRASLDGASFFSAWRDQSPTVYTGSFSIPSTGTHTIVVEYYERGGGAVARFAFTKESA
jgi:hypothetical protein